MINQKKTHSGIEGLDTALDHIRYGDTVTWQISDIREYVFFARKLVERSIEDKRNVVYFNFGREPALATKADRGVHIYDIDISAGFEQSVIQITDIIENEGSGTHYIFDSLTDLQDEWVADFIVTNFFVVTVPEIVKANSVAYFAFMRGRHSTETASRIRENTSILLDIVHRGRSMYVHPVKVFERYLPTIFLPHSVDIDDPDTFEPITNGIRLAEYFALVGQTGNLDMTRSLDNWERFFTEKRELALAGKTDSGEIRDLCRLIFTPDEKVLDIAERNITLDDILAIKARMIGVGSIGGKATGMILSRLIVAKQLPEVAAVLEPHDSFYICSNLYYTFLVKNKCWSLKIKQRKQRGYFGIAEILKEKILEGVFSDSIREQFRQMLEYFGQSPIIVRSSSLLEDGFGNAFAGKYESVFCVNRGTLEERLESFENAIRTVYASTMDESVLEYRLKRGLAPRDEQMGLLVQRVSGSLFQDIYMPAVAGVCFSHNQYRWNKDIDPKAGIIRIVLGLGTRAVDRTEGDYPRLAALDQPSSRAMKGEYDSDFTQKKVDVLDLTVNSLSTISIEEAERRMKQWFRDIMIERDFRRERELKKVGIERRIIYTSCDRILQDERFVSDIRAIMKAVESEYSYPVDVEFALNISKDGDYMINLLQCRPLHVGGSGIRATLPEVPREDTFFKLTGGTMGGAYYSNIDIVIRIDPRKYYEYPYNLKPAVARLVGQINQFYKDGDTVIMLLVPGRLGTTSPELGVPVKFAEISNIKITCEVSYEGAGYLPELSYGSHFFQDLVEADIFYAAIFENKGTTEFYEPEFFKGGQNILPDIVPDASAELVDIVQVYDVGKQKMRMVSELETGLTLCGYFTPLDENGAPLRDEEFKVNRLNI